MKPQHAQTRGQALLEYALLVSMGVGALAAPVFSGRSIMGLMLEAFAIYMDSLQSVLALPVP